MTRIDILLTEKGLVKSREKAKALIIEGVVFVNGIKAEKAGDTFAEDSDIQIKEDPIPFVSRGGLKLQKALDVFPISLKGKICADIGASTGGFTDCMLQHGAIFVYAVDVGYGQLDWKLRNDNRVNVMERTNARYMEPGWFDKPLGFASIDVSFISLDKILPPLFDCIQDNGEVVALIKPQFEAGKSEVGKNGVVRDKDIHEKVIESVIYMAERIGFSVCGLSYSPITGPKGNIEFLLFLRKNEESERILFEKSIIQKIVESAHLEHDK